MNKYPPSQEQVLNAFVNWLSHDGATYEVAECPDKTERNIPEIDYVLKQDKCRREIAVEITSLWRSTSAGMEDVYWERWTAEVGTLLCGKVPGKYRMYTPLRVPWGMKADSFATEVTKIIFERRADLAASRQRGKGLTLQVLGVNIVVSQASADGAEVTFARRLTESDLNEFAPRAREAVSNRSSKLRRHKGLGRETWLVAYNTFWTAIDISDIRRDLLAGLGPDFDIVDHIGIVAGDPPDDAWVSVVK